MPSKFKEEGEDEKFDKLSIVLVVHLKVLCVKEKKAYPIGR